MRAFNVFLVMLVALEGPAQAELDENCHEVARKYLIKGDLASPFGGDRLWSLSRVQQAYQKQNDGECLEMVRNTALEDAKEYWSGYISVKYSCNSEQSLELPAEKPAACPQDKWDLVQRNIAYIEGIESGNSARVASSPAKTQGRARNASKKAEVCDPKIENAFQPFANLKSDLVRTEAEVSVDPCAKYGIKKEHQKNSTSTEKDLSKLKACVFGGGQGLSNLADSAKDGLKSVIAGYNKLASFIKDPGYRASVMAAISDLASVLASSPVETMKAIKDALVSSVSEYDHKIQCMNSDGMTAELCNQLANKGLPALLGVGAIRGIALMLKSGKKATTGAIVIRDAARSATAAESVATASVTNSAAGDTAIKSLAGPAREAAKEAAKEAKKEAPEMSKGTKAAYESRARAGAKAKAQAEEKARIKAAEDAAKAREEALIKNNKINPLKDADEIQNIKDASIRSHLDVKDALNLTDSATAEDVRAAIRKLTQKYHPDFNPDHKQISQEVTAKLNAMKKFAK